MEHRHGSGERIGTVRSVDPEQRLARVALERALDSGEHVAAGEDLVFRADVRIGEHPVTRGAPGQEVVLSSVPPELREGDVLERRTTTFGSMLRDAGRHLERR